jgi:Fe-S cluster assembly protein SufD
MQEMESWLSTFQQEGRQRWSEFDLQTLNRTEGWKYTHLKPLQQGRFAIATSASANRLNHDQAFLEYRGNQGVEIVFVNGQYAPTLSNLTALPAGIRIGSLGQCLKIEAANAQQLADATLVQQILDMKSSTDEDAFVALNRSHLNDGCLIVVEEEALIETPLHLIYWSDPTVSEIAADAQMVSHPRTVIAVGARASVSILESYVGWHERPYWMNAVTDIQLATASSMRLCKVQAEASQASHLGHHRVYQAQDSSFTSFHLSVGAKWARHDLAVEANGAQTFTALYGLYLGVGEQHIDNSTVIHHRAPRGVSRQHYKGILDEKSRGVFRGKIRIEAEAQQTDSSQLNNNLLLTSQAEIDTLPQLEIFNDDVKATHGATVGQLNEEEIFYIESRGIARDLARQMVLRGFAEEIVNKLDSAELRGPIQHLVHAALAQMRTP